MALEKEEEIIYLYERYLNRSCTCFQGHPPCSKCELMPNEEEYKNALQRIDRGYE